MSNYYYSNDVTIPAGTEKVYMRLKNDRNVITAFYSFDGIIFNKFTWGANTEHCTHLAYGGFLSLRPGIQVSGSGSAVFDYFTHVPIKED